MNRRTFTVISIALLLVVWAGLVAGFALLAIRASVTRAGEELEAEGAALQRIVSRRLVQHDAHLTGLAALVLAGDPPPTETIRQVALALVGFTPRVLSVRVMEIARDTAVNTLVAVPAEAARKPPPEFVPQVFGQRTGETLYYAESDSPGRYFLGKRIGSPDRRVAIVLEIDPLRLLEADEWPAAAQLSMGLGPHALAVHPAVGSAADGRVLTTLHYEGDADSQSQPIRLSLERPVTWLDAVPPVPLAGFALVSLLALLAGRYTLLQRAAAREARQLAAAAEERGRMLERETRLAHAARANSLGELASGFAQELNQPLGALLAQSQAALRLAGPEGDQRRLAEALDANMREARRAGDVLKRMRSYMSRHAAAQGGPADLNDVVNDAAMLARLDLTRRGIRLVLDLEPRMPPAIVDTIELEQVLHNLIRNAADSLEESAGADREITIRTFDAGDTVAIRVSDNGRGISPEIMPRLFEPFFTTKAGGLGLGLSLCATLVERAGGTVEADTQPERGASFVVSFPAAPLQRLAAQ